MFEKLQSSTPKNDAQAGVVEVARQSGSKRAASEAPSTSLHLQPELNDSNLATAAPATMTFHVLVSLMAVAVL